MSNIIKRRGFFGSMLAVAGSSVVASVVQAKSEPEEKLPEVVVMPPSMEIPTFDQLYQKLLEDEEYVLTELEVLVYANEINRVAWEEDYPKIMNNNQIALDKLKIVEYWGRIIINKGPNHTNLIRVHKQVNAALVSVLLMHRP
jgi:hypothetical protein